jgi:pilus assembly protein CpaB
MTKLIQNKLFIGILCIVLAAVVAFLLLPKFYKSQAATENVIRASQDIPAGTVLTSEMVTTSEVGAYGLPSDVLRADATAVGMVASENLYAGEYLTGKHLMTEDEYKKAEQESKLGLTGGMSLITIEFPSSSAGVAGVLRSGDTADVYEYIKEKNENGEEVSLTELAMSGIYVFDVLNRNMESLSDLDARKEALPEGDNTTFDFAPAFVVLRCDQQQILTLIRLERTDALHLALAKGAK